jgi:uncharacterized SAM-binding protein YcdF (DUF218 family)
MAAILTPMALLHGAIALAIVHLWWKSPECRRRLFWVAVPFFLLTLLSTDPARYLAMGSLEWPYPPSDEIPQDARAIVVLAGWVRSPDPVYTRPELGPDTLYRCLHAATLHRKAKDRLILVSGGPDPNGGPPFAQVMRDFLVDQGVERSNLIVEDRSQNTYENAVASCRILGERSIRRIVLVTTATHMARACACFKRQGIEVVPSPCNYRATHYYLGWTDFIPDVQSATQMSEAWHEWLGLLAYWGQGRL